MDELREALVDLDKARVLELVEEQLQNGRDPLEMIAEARVGLEEVGKRFDQGEYFLLELLRAANIFEEAAKTINPKVAEVYGTVETKGLVVLGTVAGDVHDLGKNIVKLLLECQGVRVIDLGVDVAPANFVNAVREHQPNAMGMSALLTASIPQMKLTIGELADAGLRDDVKVIVGGGIVGEVNLDHVGADYATADANDGVKMIAQWIASA